MAKVVKLPEKTPIPTNWRWVDLGKLTETLSGYPFDSQLFSTDANGRRPLIRIRDVVRGYTETFTSEECSDEYVIHKDDILIGMDGDFNVQKWAQGDALLNQRVCTIKSTSDLLSNDFLFYYLPQPLKYINQATPSVTVKHLSTKTIAKIPFPLPPRNEQERIVACIEELFEKLDAAEEKLRAVVEGSPARRAALLRRAFTGDLTASWRAANGRTMDTWEETQVKQVCKDIKVGIVIKPSQYYTNADKGIPAFRSANVREFRVDDKDWVYLDERGQKENQRSIVHAGDILIVRSGNPGTACVVTKEFDGYNAIDILIAVPDQEKIRSDFLCAYTNSPVGRKLVADNKRGMALAHFNVGGYSKLPISVPPLDEQKEIVRLLDELLAREDEARAAAEAALAKIPALRQAVLARAFRGQLGTNDPAEPSALSE